MRNSIDNARTLRPRAKACARRPGILLAPPTPIFMITAYGSVEAAVKALKLGANDYFSKPWENDKLIIEIDRMIARRRLEYENTHLKRALKQRYSFPNIIGKSERMVRMLDLVGQVASSRSTILTRRTWCPPACVN